MKKILLVEDNQTFLEMLTAFFKLHLKDFAVVLTAQDGREAVKHLEANRIDLIVSDVQMPGMDGYALADFRNRYYPDIPIIGMSCDLNQEAMVRLESLGVKQYLAKPFDVHQMIAAVSQELALSLSHTAVA